MTVLVGQKAPDFTAPAVLSDGSISEITLSDFAQDKYALIFFYPLDFTFVCPSELIALNNRIADFKALGVQVLSVSIDSQFTHHAWRNTAPDAGGIGSVDYTMVADISHSICRDYGVEHPEAKVALRGAFVIDKAGIVRAQLVNDLPIGRNIDEIVRLFDALQFHETHGEVCPVGWNKGDKGMRASADGVAEYLGEHAETLK
jgi:peroxiredoxin (alkyl hydroperoxide reductase subunit C)